MSSNRALLFEGFVPGFQIPVVALKSIIGDLQFQDSLCQLLFSRFGAEACAVGIVRQCYDRGLLLVELGRPPLQLLLN